MTTSSVPMQQPLSLPATTKKGRKFRLIPKFEDDPRIVSFAQTVVGKLVLLAIFGLVLSTMDEGWKMKLAFLSAMAFLPQLRWLLVLACTLVLTSFFSLDQGFLNSIARAESVQLNQLKLAALVLLPFVLACAAFMLLAALRPKGLFARRPLPWLLGIFFGLLLIACYAPLHGSARLVAWALVFVFSSYFWFLAYAISDCVAVGKANLLHQFATFRAFWGSTAVPIPKGTSHWRRIEAKTPEDLAVTMIKGVKLMVWCLLLSYVNHYYAIVVQQKLAIPNLEQCLNAFTGGKPFPMVVNWASLLGDFLEGLLWFAVWGHIVIATCRMAGFRALRNTYAPLSSRTVAEYWNRYYYYFKELLVDMFFYPTFVRYFKRSPKLRIFFATFAAASVGNVIFHFMRDIHNVLKWGLPRSIVGFQIYVFYSLILALGISISQVRARKPHASRGWLHQRIAAPAVVFSFYCLVHVFDSTGLGGLGSRLHFLLYLFSGR
ncbi:MAG TPA: hypothetical protein VG649_21650 [Candidatus Angelobacter sp.]|nr:hypothetical protein [Candidatus Angelobacter sp.]